jgi:hypothetical protein
MLNAGSTTKIWPVAGSYETCVVPLNALAVTERSSRFTAYTLAPAIGWSSTPCCTLPVKTP